MNLRLEKTTLTSVMIVFLNDRMNGVFSAFSDREHIKTQRGKHAPGMLIKTSRKMFSVRGRKSKPKNSASKSAAASAAPSIRKVMRRILDLENSNSSISSLSFAMILMIVFINIKKYLKFFFKKI